MTAAEVTSFAINKHSQVQGAEVSYWNSCLLAKVSQCVCKYSTVFTQHNYT